MELGPASTGEFVTFIQGRGQVGRESRRLSCSDG
jgi:hypothetical protein